jgi:hypothetical protein
MNEGENPKISAHASRFSPSKGVGHDGLWLGFMRKDLIIIAEKSRIGFFFLPGLFPFSP